MFAYVIISNRQTGKYCPFNLAIKYVRKAIWQRATKLSLATWLFCFLELSTKIDKKVLCV